MNILIRNDWNLDELEQLHDLPLIELISQANKMHAIFHQPGEIQISSLLSIKTGGCPEDCKYCAQSSRYQTAVSAEPLMKVEDVISKAKKAQSQGATRFCLGAAWREVRDGRQFEEILKMVKEISGLGMEVCCTLGMLKEHQARALKAAGLHAYNHNLDTSEDFYRQVITSRSYQDRLDTLDTLERVGISICCGGILGLGESTKDRLSMLHTLCTRARHPDSVPINRLTPIPGTPMEEHRPVAIWEMLRIIAVARIVMPMALVRLSSGRSEMSIPEQALCFLAGANSIHIGEKLLTVANTAASQDEEMFRLLGLVQRPAYTEGLAACKR